MSDDNLFLLHLKDKAREIAPEYPFTQDDPWEDLWAITSTYEGVKQANEDCHRVIRHLMAKLGLGAEDYLAVVKSAQNVGEQT